MHLVFCGGKVVNKLFVFEDKIWPMWCFLQLFYIFSRPFSSLSITSYLVNVSPLCKFGDSRVVCINFDVFNKHTNLIREILNVGKIALSTRIRLKICNLCILKRMEKTSLCFIM